MLTWGLVNSPFPLPRLPTAQIKSSSIVFLLEPRLVHDLHCADYARSVSKVWVSWTSGVVEDSGGGKEYFNFWDNQTMICIDIVTLHWLACPLVYSSSPDIIFALNILCHMIYFIIFALNNQSLLGRITVCLLHHIWCRIQNHKMARGSGRYSAWPLMSSVLARSESMIIIMIVIIMIITINPHLPRPRGPRSWQRAWVRPHSPPHLLVRQTGHLTMICFCLYV